jgi:hypothetical protein
MNYAEYLFSQLLSVYDDEFKNAPHQEQYYSAMRLYKDFMSSNYNKTNKAEYDCICDYLSANQHRNVKLVEEIVETLKQHEGITYEVWHSVSDKMGFPVQDKVDTSHEQLWHSDAKYIKELEHRLEMIADDSRDLREFIYSNGLQKKFSTPDEFENITSGEEGFTFLNNIDIACDLGDNESLGWKNKNK